MYFLSQFEPEFIATNSNLELDPNSTLELNKVQKQ
jgi:hypothetical protein